MQRQPRTLTSATVAATLSKAGIPALGSNKLQLLSRVTANKPYAGTKFTREDGTQVRIMNVLAFRDKTAQDAAVASWKQGSALEKAGDIESAQEHYKAAYNNLMSFSVLEENASAFEGVHEVTGYVELVPAGKDLQAAGIKSVIGFNRPAPVAIVSNMTSSASAFVIEEEAAPAKTKVKTRVTKAAA